MVNQINNHLAKDIGTCKLLQVKGYSKLTWENIERLLEHVYPEGLTNKDLNQIFHEDIHHIEVLTKLMVRAGHIGKLTPKEGTSSNVYYSVKNGWIENDTKNINR
jgi:hypothetical protein